jgi:hypothetical protein
MFLFLKKRNMSVMLYVDSTFENSYRSKYMFGSSLILPFRVHNQDITQYGNSYAIYLGKGHYLFGSYESFFTIVVIYDAKKYDNVDTFIVKTIETNFPFHFIKHKIEYLQAFNFEYIVSGTEKITISAVNRIDYKDIHYLFMVISKLVGVDDITTLIERIMVNLFVLTRIKNAGCFTTSIIHDDYLIGCFRTALMDYCV